MSVADKKNSLSNDVIVLSVSVIAFYVNKLKDLFS